MEEFAAYKAQLNTKVYSLSQETEALGCSHNPLEPRSMSQRSLLQIAKETEVSKE